MRNEIQKSKIYERRAFVLGGIKLSVLTLLSARLYHLQIIKSDEYKTMSDGNRIKLIPVLPLRGKILDRHGRAIVENKTHYRVQFDTLGKKNFIDNFNKAAEIVGITEEKKEIVLKKIAEIRGRDPVTMEEYLTWEQVAKVELAKPDVPGLFIETGQVRYFPYSNVSAHVVGYVSAPNKNDNIEDTVLLNHPDFKIGKNGIEKIAEETLKGKPGIKRVEVNVHGASVRELSIEEAVSGEDVYTTLDIDLQKFAGQRMAGVGGVSKEGAAAVCIDVENGDVISMVSTPGYDANQFIRGISPEYWKELSTDLDVPLMNKTIGTQYPPGSTFKMITGLAALQAGIINQHTSIFCPGFMMLGSRRFNCWKKEGHGSMTVRDALCHSCNTFFYTVSQRLGVDRIAEMAFKFGLGEKTNVGLPSEKPGIIPSRKWKRERFGKEWLSGETINTGIGQGYVLTTPMQLALMTARIASVGKKVIPRLIKTKEEALAPNNIVDFADIEAVSKEHLQVIMEGMEMAVNQAGGTAYASRIDAPEFAMAGKTGTAQVKGRKPSDDGSKEPEEKRLRNHALYVGYAPVYKPKFAVGVLVEHGSKGSAAAAPVGRDILLEAQRIHVMRGGNLMPEEVTE